MFKNIKTDHAGSGTDFSFTGSIFYFICWRKNSCFHGLALPWETLGFPHDWSCNLECKTCQIYWGGVTFDRTHSNLAFCFVLLHVLPSTQVNPPPPFSTHHTVHSPQKGRVLCWNACFARKLPSHLPDTLIFYHS